MPLPYATIAARGQRHRCGDIAAGRLKPIEELPESHAVKPRNAEFLRPDGYCDRRIVVRGPRGPVSNRDRGKSALFTSKHDTPKLDGEAEQMLE